MDIFIGVSNRSGVQLRQVELIVAPLECRLSIVFRPRKLVRFVGIRKHEESKMKVENNSEGVLERVNKTAVPTLSAIATIVALTTVSDPLIKYPAIIVSISLLCLVLYPLLRKAIHLSRLRWFPKRLSKRQRVKLSVLLIESNSFTSSSHTYSLFYMWSSYASRLGIGGGAFQEYHSVIKSHFIDMRDLLEGAGRDEMNMLRKMSFAVREVGRAAEGMCREYEEAIRRGSADESTRRQVRSEWNGCVSKFNMWIGEWERFLREANHTAGAGCVDYMPTLKMLD